jgi:hypothetical protein
MAPRRKRRKAATRRSWLSSLLRFFRDVHVLPGAPQRQFIASIAASTHHCPTKAKEGASDAIGPRAWLGAIGVAGALGIAN